MAAPAAVAASSGTAATTGTAASSGGMSLGQASAALQIGGAIGNLVALPFNARNEYKQYGTQQQNAANTVAALWQERDYTLGIYDRESRQLAANQTLAFIMSGLDASGSGQVGESTVQNVQRITAQERATDRQRIEENYNTQIYNAWNQQKAAEHAKKNSMWSNIAQGAGTAVGIAASAMMMFSDERLKERLIPIGKSKNGLTIYLGRYTKESGLDDGKVHLFLIAQEVQRIRPNAVKIADNGYFQVDYAAALL